MRKMVLRLKAAELGEYLDDLRRELGDLGPLERNGVVREVRSDISELAERRQSGSTDSGAIQAAIREMPSAFEVAQEYLRTHGPPLLITRLAIGLNLFVGFAAFLIVSLGILSTVRASHLWASNLVLIMVAMTLLVASCAAIAAYGIALISPRRATRWRFGILPAAAVSLLADGVLLAVVSGFDWRIAMTLLAGTLLAGTYVISYAHRQLARLDVQDLYTSESGDYLRAIAKGVRDLDRIRRREVLVELRSHVEASRIDISRLEPAARRAKLEELLGSPTEVATAYMDRFGGPLPRKWRRGLIGLLLIAATGFVVGSVVLGTGLDVSVREGGYLTALGLASSVGILGLSAILLWMAMRVYRAPAQRTDYGRPIAVAATAAVLLLSVAILGAPLGALVIQGDFVRHDVLGSVRLADGTLGVLWYSYLADESWRVIDESEPRGPVLGAWVTVVDGNGVVASTEPFPGIPPGGPLLDFARSNGSWMALFPDSLIAWGALNRNIPLASPAWYRADGHIDGSVARIGWISYSGSVAQVDFERIDLLTPSSVFRWQQTIPLVNATEPRVRVSNVAVLVAAPVNEENATHAHATVSAHLIPETGTAATNFLLHERTVELGGPGSAVNGTRIGLDGIRAIGGHFWLSGSAWTRINGTTVASTWAAHMDAATPAAVEWDLHRVSLPVPSAPPTVGDREAVIFRGSVADADRLFVASSSYRLIFSATGEWQPDEVASELLLSSLLPNGTIEYTLQLDQGIPMRSPLFPIVGISQGMPTVLAFLLGDFSVYLIGPIVPPSPVGSQSIVLQIGEWALLYRNIATQRVSAFSFDPSATGYVGEGFLQDSGFLGWRDSSSSPVQALLSVPAIFLVDFSTGSARLVPFVAPPTRPDVLLDLVLSAIVTVLATVLLGSYPRWRSTSKGRPPESRVGIESSDERPDS